MIGLLVYLFIAKMQDSYADRSATWQWALGVAIANSIFALFSTPLIYTLIGAVIIFLYAWGTSHSCVVSAITYCFDC